MCWCWKVWLWFVWMCWGLCWVWWVVCVWVGLVWCDVLMWWYCWLWLLCVRILWFVCCCLNSVWCFVCWFFMIRLWLMLCGWCVLVGVEWIVVCFCVGWMNVSSVWIWWCWCWIMSFGCVIMLVVWLKWCVSGSSLSVVIWRCVWFVLIWCCMLLVRYWSWMIFLILVDFLMRFLNCWLVLWLDRCRWDIGCRRLYLYCFDGVG